MNKTLVSIIMPVYGVERYIAKAIRSVQSQTYPNWELIVVNDGSRDSSRDIAAEFAAKDERILIIDKENGGLSDARNVGLQNVNGDYVNFFDSDDWIEPDFLLRLIEKIQTDNLDLVICGYYVDIMDSENNICQRYTKDNIPSDAVSAAEYFDLMERYMNFAWNKIYRHDFLKINHLTFEKGLWFIEDCEFISRVLTLNPKIGYINYAGYHYTQHPEVTLSKKFNNQVVDFIRRKMSLYHPVLSSLDAPRKVIEQIYEDMRAYSSAYLIKQMGKFLDYNEFKLQLHRLYTDDLLCPGTISLKRCKTKAEVLILILAKLKLLRLLHICLKR